MGRELEGKELNMHMWLNLDAAKNKNGVGAHLIGFGGRLVDGAKELWNAIGHPVDTAAGLGNFLIVGLVSTGNTSANAMLVDQYLGTDSFNAVSGFSEALDQGYNNLLYGNGLERGHVLGSAVFDIATSELGGAAFSAASKGVSKIGVFSEMSLHQKLNYQSMEILLKVLNLLGDINCIIMTELF